MKKPDVLHIPEVPLSALAQNFFRQALCGSSPILNSNFEPGYYSLLGTGTAFIGLFNIYVQSREVFSVVSDVDYIESQFSIAKSPKNPDMKDLFAWVKRLEKDEIQTIDSACRDDVSWEREFHVVYFSNRLGFRETLHSITAAIQSLSLSSLPPWNICTFFHEFIHSHLRSVFSKIYPYLSVRTKSQFTSIYEQLGHRSNPNFESKNLLTFIQSLFMSTAVLLTELENGKNFMKNAKKDKVVHSLRKWHHHLNEIIAHILDFHYFYKTQKDIYVKAIWSSWLKLPFIHSRIDEYLLRTICTLATVEEGSDEEVFHTCASLLQNNLLPEMKKYDFCDNELLDVVQERLEEPSMLLQRFSLIYSFTYTVSHVFVSSKIVGLLTDPDASEQNDESYSLEIPPETFEDREISSSVNFLQDYMRHIFRNEDFPNSFESTEFRTLWLLFAIASIDVTR